MSNRYKSSTAPVSRLGAAAMSRLANLDDATSGELIKALEGRGYKVFPAGRVVEADVGWFIEKTEHQLKTAHHPRQTKPKKQKTERRRKEQEKTKPQPNISPLVMSRSGYAEHYRVQLL